MNDDDFLDRADRLIFAASIDPSEAEKRAVIELVAARERGAPAGELAELVDALDAAVRGAIRADLASRLSEDAPRPRGERN